MDKCLFNFRKALEYLYFLIIFSEHFDYVCDNECLTV